MRGLNWRKIVVPVLLCFVLIATGCVSANDAKSPYTQVQQDTTRRQAPPAVVKDAEQGGTFNQFFPAPGEGFERIYTQEKPGFAEAKLKKDGKVMAMMSISDTISLPAAAQKYQQSTSQLAGYPTVEIGSTQTGVLVSDRFQVKVLSRDPSFIQSDRREWIQRFDLESLAQLK